VDELAAVLARGHGMALLRDFTTQGLHPNEIRAALRVRRLVRIRHGAYADAVTWARLLPHEKHRLLARAVMATLSPPVVLSHTSAAIVHGLPVWGVDLRVVHVTRPQPGRGRRERSVTHHVGKLPGSQIEVVDGMRVTSLDRTVLDIARLAGFESGVVTADAALHRRLTTPDDLMTLHLSMMDWPGSRVAGRVARFADGLAESPGESRSRVLFHHAGLPAPRLQAEIQTARCCYRVDMLVDEARTVFEFDGQMKYRMGESGDPRELERIAWEEKRREDDIRAEGYRFGRIIWSDFDDPEGTAQRARRTMWG
jgi:hypothetical protein